MFNLKQVSLSVATIAVTVGISTVFATTTQAAIVGGQVSGTWDYDWDGTGGLNVGNAFTADYTYDSDSITEYDYFNPGSHEKGRYVSLLSLVLNSGSFSHMFDLSSSGVGSIGWYSFQSMSPFHGLSDYESIFISARDFLVPGDTSFSGGFSSGIDFYGNSFSSNYAQAYSQDFYSTYLAGAESYNASFSGATPAPTSVPTPALLPGLVGLGMAALRKQRENQKQEAAETAQV